MYKTTIIKASLWRQLVVGFLFACSLLFALVGPAHAAIAHDCDSGIDTSPTSITKPSCTSSGDVLIAVFAVDRNSTTTPTITASGWTVIESFNNSTTVDQLTAAYYKVAGGSEPSSYSFTLGTEGVGAIVVYSGVDTSSVIDVSDGQTNGTASTLTSSFTAPSISTTIANTMLVHVAGSLDTSSITWTPGLTNERIDGGSTSPDEWLSVSDQAKSGTGATGTETATPTSTGYGGSIMFALRPANTAPSITVNPSAGYGT
jgi:hypothetical protein